MKTFHEYITQGKFPVPEKPSFRKAALEKLTPQKQPQLVGPHEIEFDPQEEEVYADLVQQMQEFMTIDRNDIVSLQQALAKIEHKGRIYLKYREGP
jgi:hypothetical protein